MLLSAPRHQLLFPLIRRYALQGVVWGVVYSLLRFGLAQQEVALVGRHALIGLGVELFVGLGEAVIGRNFRHQPFLFLLLVRTALYITVAALRLLAVASLKYLYLRTRSTPSSSVGHTRSASLGGQKESAQRHPRPNRLGADAEMSEKSRIEIKEEDV